MSMTKARPSAGPMLRCKCSASPIWSPMVCSGDSEVIGSWKMIEMEPPRIPRICGPSRSSLAMSTMPPVDWLVRQAAVSSRISPPTILAALGRMPMIAWAQTDFPEPDSPTRATVLPAGTRNETPRTAFSVAPSSAKSTCRFLTVNRSVIR